MGLFSRHQQPQQSTYTPSNEKLYIFIRCPDISSDDEAQWSLAVTNTIHNNHVSQQNKPKKSLLSFTERRPSKQAARPSTTDHQCHHHQQQQVTSTTTIHEFTLLSGTLKISQHHPSPHPNRSESLLLAILLPPVQRTGTSTQPLHLQTEQALHRLSSTTAHFSDDETSMWLKLALIALQQGKILPPATTTTGLNVDRCMEFARNAWTGFEGEMLRLDGGGGGGGGADEVVGRDLRLAGFVKAVDYRAHVLEVERVTAVLRSQEA